MDKWSEFTIGGVVVPIVTPLTSDEEVDVPALRNVVDHLIAGGVHGIFVLGTTGEFARLDESQKEAAISAVIEQTNGRIPVYVGVSDCGTKKAIRNIRMAERLGADILVCTLPYYYPVESVQEQILFFESVAGSTHLPMMLYNMPGTVGTAIDVAAVAAIARLHNVIGIKDSSGTMEYFREISRLAPDGMNILIGSEAIAKAGLLAGAHGIVPSLGNVFPRLFVELFMACQHGRMSVADDLQQRIDRLNILGNNSDSWFGDLIFRKTALRMMGLCGDKIMEPYLKINPATEQMIFEVVSGLQKE